MIPYGKQEITDDDIEAVVKVLKSEFLTQGPIVPIFEEKVAHYCGAKFAVAVTNATSALHLSCMALNIGPGDIVWTTPNSFVASANCARYCGAEIDFVDIDPENWNISIDHLDLKLRKAEINGALPKLLICVHLCGQSCDMKAIKELAIKYGFRIVEDASHAVGGKFMGSPIGSCTYSDITVFSFHPVKIITTGEGGIALTNNQDIAVRMARLRSHGIVRNADDMTMSDPEPWRYEQLELGYNYRMTDIQAAIGVSQLERLDTQVSKRNEIASSYIDLLSSLQVDLPRVISKAYSSWHLFVIRVRKNTNAHSHREIFSFLRANGIGVNLHYTPIHLHPYYRSLGFRQGMFPEAEAYGESAITLPIYPSLSSASQKKVSETLHQIIPS